MITKLISKSQVKGLLAEVSDAYKTYVPIEQMNGDILFELLPQTDKDVLNRELKKINFSDKPAVISPKDILFPQIEKMMEFENNKVVEIIDSSKKLIFGIRPCDLKAMYFVDDFFKRNFEDVYYLSRTKERVIIAIGCLAPPRPEACFCTSAKTGPFLKDGFDIQLVDIGDDYLAEIASSAGEVFVEDYKEFFGESKDKENFNAEVVKEKAAGNIGLKVSFDEAIGLLKRKESVHEDNYKRISERCIYCGGCIYTCPTCTCFNVFDDIKGMQGHRCRNWDACVFEGYTREASGHNPRREKEIRTARRYEHKLKYDHQITGMSGCVGCGRCLESCPVNIGMSKFIAEITENKRIM